MKKIIYIILSFITLSSVLFGFTTFSPQIIINEIIDYENSSDKSNVSCIYTDSQLDIIIMVHPIDRLQELFAWNSDENVSDKEILIKSKKGIDYLFNYIESEFCYRIMIVNISDNNLIISKEDFGNSSKIFLYKMNEDNQYDINDLVVDITNKNNYLILPNEKVFFIVLTDNIKTIQSYEEFIDLNYSFSNINFSFNKSMFIKLSRENALIFDELLN